MGQKVNPHGLRVGVIKDWDSRWYARDEKVGDLLVEDYNLRKELKKRLYSAGVPKIEIERDNAKVRIYVHCSRPGVVIGKGGEDIKKIEAALTKLTGKVIPCESVVKIDDTAPGMICGNNAGAWTIGLYASGSNDYDKLASSKPCLLYTSPSPRD